MNWYLGITTSKMISPFPGHEKIRGEAAVEKQLRAMGLDCFVPTQIVFKRQGKNRYAEPWVDYLCPNYIFANVPADRYAEALGAKGLARCLMRIPNREAEMHLRPFRARLDDDNAKAMKIIDEGDKRAMCEFKPGDVLEIISGPFADQCVEFCRNVREVGAPFDLVEAEVEVFGQKARVRVDPLDVKRVG